jgi:single-strand DNA-binding protein
MNGIRMSAIGHLGKDAELRFLSSGTPVLEVPVAANEAPYTAKDGTIVKRVEWATVRLFGPRAEKLAPFLKKGRQVYVEGSQRTDKWVGDDGAKHYRAYLRAQDIQLLGKREVSKTESVEHEAEAEQARDEAKEDMVF